MMRQAPTPEPKQTDESSPAGEMSYLQALYIAFWKPIFLVFCIVHALVAVGIVKFVWPDAVGYGYIVAILLAIAMAYFDLEWLARAVGLDDGPIMDWHERFTYLTLGGYALAVALAAGLAVHEASERAASRAYELQKEQEKARMHEIINSPNYKAAEEFLRARQQREQQKR